MSLRVGQLFENPCTGERGIVRIAPDDSNSRLLVVDLYARPGAAVVGEHVHPGMSESFTVVTGRLGVKRGGREDVALPGARLTVPAGVTHDWWNAGEEEAHVIVEVHPGDRFEQMIRHFFFLAQDGRTNAKGMPPPWVAVLLAKEFDDTIRLTHPPRWVQVLAAAVLAPVARVIGRGVLSPEYLSRDVPVVGLADLPSSIIELIPALHSAD